MFSASTRSFLSITTTTPTFLHHPSQTNYTGKGLAPRKLLHYFTKEHQVDLALKR